MRERHHGREEIANAITHGAGVVLALSGGAVLVTLSAVFGNARQILSASIFTLALVLLYTASTLYHAIPHVVAKSRLKVFDHCAIFFLIAGTYTPFALVTLKGAWSWSILILVWSLALIGIVFKLFFTGRYKRLSTLIYIGMGWVALIAIVPLVNALTNVQLTGLFGGGLAYTLGTLFYLNERLPYSHAFWHLSVLCGSVFHYAVVFSQVVPTLQR